MTGLIKKLACYQSRSNVISNCQKFNAAILKELQLCLKIVDVLDMKCRTHRFRNTHWNHPTSVAKGTDEADISDTSDGRKLIPGRPGQTSFAQLPNKKGI